MLKPHQQEKPKRDKKILAYKEKGYSLKQISGIFHLSRERVRQIVKRQKKVIHKSTT